MAVILLLGDKSTILLPNGEFPIEVVRSESDMRRGLGNREEIGTAGMLFVFKKEDKHGIWMKDMRFPIDILWLDSKYKVVSVAENVSPDTFPKIFYPHTNAKYVFEAKAGFSAENKIYEDIKLHFSF